MTFSTLGLRHKLLLLSTGIGIFGLLGLALVIYLAYRQLVDQFLPESRSLRDLESRSASLIQTYYQFVFTRDLVVEDELRGQLVLIRQSLGEYRGEASASTDKRNIGDDIANSVDELERAGLALKVARQRFEQIHLRQARLIEEIESVFARYRNEVSQDIGQSIDTQAWQPLVKEFLPELRMLDSIQQQYLRLFLEIRESQLDPGLDNSALIDALQQRIRVSNSMFDLFEENSARRAWLSTNILLIYRRMIELLEQHGQALQQARFAVSLAEQSGIDLKLAIGEAVREAESSNWAELIRSLAISGALLLLILATGYALIFFGLVRMLRPLQRLQQSLARVGRGELHQQVEVESTDEVGRLSEEFNRMSQRLEDEAVERRHLIDELEQKNTELERFTYTVSHELKSPLVTVNGFLGLLERDLAAGEEARISGNIDQIRKAVDTMSRQLEDLLELSRVGRLVDPAQRFSLSDAGQDALSQLEGVIGQNLARVEIAPGMPLVQADSQRVGEVFRNLIENAIKFHAGTGKPEITISAIRREGQVETRVCDNGPGIEAQFRERVFELFDRLDDSVPGTGIGLALVRRIVELHGGRIWIESPDTGRGSCFCFTLPLAQGA